jgi:hypothetical protein
MDMDAMDIEEDTQAYDMGQQWFPLGRTKTPNRVLRTSPITKASASAPRPKTSYQVGEYIPPLWKSPGSSATATYMTGIKNTSPIITPNQMYDHVLNRPFSPIQTNTSLNTKPVVKIIKPIPVIAPSNRDKYGRPTTYRSYKRSLAADTEDRDADWGIYDKDFYGGKKRRTRKVVRSRRSKKAVSRRRQPRRRHKTRN